VIWDGKDLAAIQMATAGIPREHGRPAAEVDAEWNLTVAGVPLWPGDAIEVSPAGEVTYDLREHRSCSQCRVVITDPHRDHKMDCTRRGQPGDRP
jgi:hypothetical protein